MAGNSLLFLGSSIGLYASLQFLAGTEGHNAPRGDRNLLAGLGISARAAVFIAQIKVAETRELHLGAVGKRAAHLFEKHVDQFARLALVQPQLVEQRLRHFRLGKCHTRKLSPCSYSLNLAFNPVWRLVTTAATISSASRSVRVRDKSCKIKPKAMLFRPVSTPFPEYTSNILSSCSRFDVARLTRSAIRPKVSEASTVKEMSRRSRGKA